MTDQAPTKAVESELTLLEGRLVSATFQFLSPLQTGPIDLNQSSFTFLSKVSKTKKEIRVFLTFNSTPQEKTKDLFKISASYYGLFKATESTTEEELLNFAKTNAPAIVFPSLRAAISILTLGSGFPALTLPVLNFHKTSVTVEIE